jgi:predicted transcriptional regulator
MADDGFKIELDAALGERLREAAEAVGQTASDYASALIAEALGSDWEAAKTSLAHYDQTGEFVDAGEALASLRARLVARFDQSH